MKSVPVEVGVSLPIDAYHTELLLRLCMHREDSCKSLKQKELNRIALALVMEIAKTTLATTPLQRVQRVVEQGEPPPKDCVIS